MKIKEKKYHKGEVIQNRRVSESLWLIEFKPERPLEIRAGQFVSILCDNLTLRRPFSVCSFENGVIGVLFKKKGLGTEFISNLRIGDEIDFIGAFGNGFNIENKKSLLIGAGVGVAPVFYLKNELIKNNIESILASGFLTKNEVPQGIVCDEIVTSDGSIGKNGSIIDYIEELITTHHPEKIYSCGPEIVLKKVTEMGIKYNIPTEVALEKVMACGIGVCRGCVIKVKTSIGEENRTICHDGPVFEGDKILWD